MEQLGIVGLSPGQFIGAGATSRVFSATRLAFGNQVAVRVFTRSYSETTFSTYVEKLKDIGGRTPTVLESGKTEADQHYLLLTLFGSSAQTELQRIGPMPWEQALDLVVQATKTVMRAHEKGLVHHNLKPSKLLVSKQGSVFVADFCSSILTPVQQDDAYGLRLHFAAPELLTGSGDSRADIYSLGAVLATLITGERPFESASSEQLLSRVLHEPPPNLSGVSLPKSLVEVVVASMAKDPDDRPQSAAELLRELAAITGETDTGPDPDEDFDLSPPSDWGTGRELVREIGGLRGELAQLEHLVESKQNELNELVRTVDATYRAALTLDGPDLLGAIELLLIRCGVQVGRIDELLSSEEPGIDAVHLRIDTPLEWNALALVGGYQGTPSIEDLIELNRLVIRYAAEYRAPPDQIFWFINHDLGVDPTARPAMSAEAHREAAKFGVTAVDTRLLYCLARNIADELIEPERVLDAFRMADLAAWRELGRRSAEDKV